MALTDKLGTIDTIGDLARNGEFLGELVNQLDEGKVESILGKITTAGKKVVQVSDLGKKAVVDPIIGSKEFKAAILNDGTNPITTVDGILGKLDEGKVESILGKITTAGKKVVQVSDLGKKAVVDPIIGSKEFKAAILNDGTNPITTVDDLLTKLTTGDDKNKKVYTEKAVDDAIKLKADATALSGLVLGQGPSAEAVATQLLSITNKDKLGKAILDVKKDSTNDPALETDLAGNKTLQDAVASNDTLKKDLAKPEVIAGVKALQDAVATNTDLRTAVKSALASDTTFQGNVKIEVNSEEPGFQGAVRGVMSKPAFEIPADENAPLSWDWI